MIKRLLIALLCLGFASQLQAQQTYGGIQSLINSNIKSNGVGAITGPVLNNVLSQMNTAIFQTPSVPVQGSVYLKCNGTNETVGMQKFINAVLAQGSGFLPAGTCLTDNFNFNSFPYIGAPTPVIHGSGINQTYVKWTSGHSGGVAFSTIGNGLYQIGLSLTDLTITGNSAVNPGAGDCVVINTMFLVSFQNVGITDCPEHAINIHGVSGSYFGGLTMQGGQVVNWGQNSASTSSGLFAGPYLYDISISDGTEFAGGPATSLACIEINTPSNGVRIFDLNIDCGSTNSQVFITNTTGPTETWSQLVGNFIHGAAGSEGITITNSKEVVLSGNMFFGGTKDDIHITDSNTISVSGGTTNSATTRAQSVQLSGSTTGVSVTGMAFSGTFSTNAIVEDNSGPDYNAFIGNTGPSGIGTTITGAHSGGLSCAATTVNLTTFTIVNGIITHC